MQEEFRHLGDVTHSERAALKSGTTCPTHMSRAGFPQEAREAGLFHHADHHGTAGLNPLSQAQRGQGGEGVVV